MIAWFYRRVEPKKTTILAGTILEIMRGNYWQQWWFRGSCAAEDGRAKNRGGGNNSLGVIIGGTCAIRLVKSLV